MIAAKYLDTFGGFVAFKMGKAVRTKSGKVKVFSDFASAEKAANASKMGMYIHLPKRKVS